MNIITQIQTNDGRIHANEDDARRHLDSNLGVVVTGLARRFAAADRYQLCIAIIMASTVELRQIVAIQDELDAGITRAEP